MKVTLSKDKTPNRSHTCRKCDSYLEFHSSEAVSSACDLLIRCPICKHESFECEWKTIVPTTEFIANLESKVEEAVSTTRELLVQQDLDNLDRFFVTKLRVDDVLIALQTEVRTIKVVLFSATTMFLLLIIIAIVTTSH